MKSPRNNTSAGNAPAPLTDPDAPPLVKVVRLSINLAPDIANKLKALCAAKALTITEGIKRAIRLWQLVEDVQSEGGRVLVESTDSNGETIYKEIVFV